MDQRPYWWRDNDLPGRRSLRSDRSGERPYWWDEDQLPDLPDRSGYLREDRRFDEGGRRAYRAREAETRMDDRDDRYFAADDRRDRNWATRARDEVKSWFGSDNGEFRRERDRMQEPDVRPDRHRHDRENRRVHRGVGPRTRFDEDEELRDMICRRLEDDPELDVSDVIVRVIDNEAIIDGAVRSRREAEHIIHLAEDVPGIVHVRDRLSRQRDRDDRVRRATIGMGYDERPLGRSHRRS